MSEDAYSRRQAKHAIGKAGRKSETRLSRGLGGRTRPASGAMVGAKGDIDLGEFLLEAKSTTSASMSLKHDWLVKIAGEALSEGKRPALAVSFVKPSGAPEQNGDWVLVPMSVFKEMTS